LSIIGRRRSREGGWTWARPPSGRGRPPAPPLLPAAGAGLIVLFVALALLGFWLWGGDDGAEGGASGTPTPTPAVTAVPPTTPTPTPTPRPTAEPSPSPVPTPTPASPTPSAQGPLFRLAAWDGERWRFEERLEGAAYREGEAVPFLLRIGRVRLGTAHFLTIRYDCEAFALLTSYDRDYGSEPALASGGPQNAIPDTTLSIPDGPGTAADDGEAGSLSLWGGTFADIGGPLPSSACTGEKSLTVGLTAASDELHLMWAAEISPGAAERDAPLRLAVQPSGAEQISVEINPGSVRPAQP
jgi:hypothetical protein